MAGMVPAHKQGEVDEEDDDYRSYVRFNYIRFYGGKDGSGDR
jgi:hypothetical protein